MNLFCSRVPYIIEVDSDPAQIATKIKLFIWGLDETEPTTPNHVIEKESFSPTQNVGSYNISPFVDDVLNNSDRALFVKVKTYYKLTTTWVLDEELELITTKGYEESNPSLTGYIFLQGNVDNRYLYTDDFTTYEFTKLTIDLLFDFDYYSDLRAKYTSSLGTEVVDYTDTGIKYLTIPKSIINDFFKEGNTFELQIFVSGEWLSIYQENIIAQCEPKFNPYILTYTNIMGGKSQLYLFKKSTLSNEYKSSDYNLAGSKQIFNKNGIQSYKLNTGFISEFSVKAIREMFLSENLGLVSSDLAISTNVVIKNSSFVEKTSLNDRNINYEFEFESATPLIQNYV